jgi:WD40 repeat protein
MARYDVFLSYNRADKPAVDEIARQLVKAGIQPWLDTWNLIPGEPWQEAIEEALDSCATCAVFIGPSGTGPWQNEEMRAAIDRRVSESKARFRVIPVLLPGAERGERSKLPSFLMATTWVEFRRSLDDEDAFHRLTSGIRGQAPGPGPGQAVYEGEGPYRGLQFFDVQHAPFFFGREALTEWLLNALRGETRFLAIVGPSGSGKSSLARAGLVAALHRGQVIGSAQWPVVICRPGPDPLESLAVGLEPHASDDVLALVDKLQEDRRRLHITTRVALQNESPRARLVMLVDQFEEVFTLCHDERVRSALIDNLLYAAQVAQGQTLVLLTLRADFYGRCAAYPALSAALSDHQVLVGPLSDDELWQAIERPAQLVGIEFEPGLVDVLLHDVRDQPGGLPLLQHALLELWGRRQGRRLTYDAYREIGGVEGALEKRADAVYAGFSPPEQEICRRIFRRLTQPGEGTGDTKRRASLQELLPAGGDWEAVEKVVQVLASANTRLITLQGSKAKPEESFVEVAHEALIRGWPRLREWISEDRAALRVHRQLTQAADEWEQSGRDVSYLYGGTRLAGVEEWATTYANEMNPLEWAFLEASIQARERERTEREARARREREALGQAKEAAERLAAEEHRRAEEQARAAEMLEIARARAEQQARLATSRQLAAQSQLVLREHPCCSLLLAVEALNVTLQAGGPSIPAAENALRQALGNCGGLGLCHHKYVRALAISPDMRWLATAGEPVHLWDLTTPDPAAGPIALPETGSTFCFSPDSHWLATDASGSDYEAACLWDLTAPDPTVDPLILRGHESSVRALAITPDSRWLVTGDEKTVRLWDLAAPDPAAGPIALHGHQDSVWSIAVSPDNRWLATGSLDKTARLWDLSALDPAHEPLVLHGHEDKVLAVLISPDGRWLVTSSHDNTQVWDLFAPDPAATPVSLAHLLSDPEAIAIGARWLADSDGFDVRLWDLATPDWSAEPKILRGHTSGVLAVALSPDGRWLITGSRDKTARLWDLARDDPTAEPIVLRGHDEQISAVTISGRWAVTGGEDSTARLWDLATSSMVAAPTVLPGCDNGIRSTISPDGRWLFADSWGKTARLWDLTSQELAIQCATLESSGLQGWPVAISLDGRWLISKDLQAKTAWLWDLALPAPLREPIILCGHDEEISAVATSFDCRWAATGSHDKTVRLWDLTSADPAVDPIILRGHTGPIRHITFSPDNHWLATCGGNVIWLWDLATLDPSARPVIPRYDAGYDRVGVVMAVSLSDRWLACGDGTTVWLWDLTVPDLAAVEPIVLRGHRDNVFAIAVSSNDRWLATGSWDHTARLWNLGMPDPAATEPIVLAGHTGSVDVVAFSPDCRWLVTGSSDHTARLWDLTAPFPATEPIILRGHVEQVRSAAFSPDHHWAVTGTMDAVWLWNLHLDELIDLARRTAGRNLSRAEWAQYFPGQAYRRTFAPWPLEEE